MTVWIADALSFVNIVLASIVVYYQIKFIRSVKVSFDWIKLLYAVVGVYWAAIYMWVLLVLPETYDVVWFGRVFIRPAFTFTLAVMVAGAMQRGRSK